MKIMYTIVCYKHARNKAIGSRQHTDQLRGSFDLRTILSYIITLF